MEMLSTYLHESEGSMEPQTIEREKKKPIHELKEL
jgi:hypothetical protein